MSAPPVALAAHAARIMARRVDLTTLYQPWADTRTSGSYPLSSGMGGLADVDPHPDSRRPEFAARRVGVKVEGFAQRLSTTAEMRG